MNRVPERLGTFQSLGTFQNRRGRGPFRLCVRECSLSPFSFLSVSSLPSQSTGMSRLRVREVFSLNGEPELTQKCLTYLRHSNSELSISPNGRSIFFKLVSGIVRLDLFCRKLE